VEISYGKVLGVGGIWRDVEIEKILSAEEQHVRLRPLIKFKPRTETRKGSARYVGAPLILEDNF